MTYAQNNICTNCSSKVRHDDEQSGDKCRYIKTFQKYNYPVNESISKEW